MRSRSFATVSAATLLALLSTLSQTPSLVAADLACTQLGANTFHIGSTLKFTWNDTQTVQIDTFNLNLYCAQDETLLQTITTLNSSSPATYPWIVNSSISAFSSSCQYNQYHGAFDWTSSDPNTGVQVKNSAKCKVMLMITDTPGAPGTANPGSSDNGGFDDEPSPSSIVVSDKTKTIVIGVGCAVGALVLAGVVGFYVIRYSNKRAAEEQMSKKLREPIQTGPLFAPKDRGNGGSGGARRYNELSSVTTGSETMGHSPATTARTTEMVHLSSLTPIGTPVMSSSNSTVLGSRSPTPIAAAHAKATAIAAAAAGAGGNGSSPSLLNPRSSITTPAQAHHYSSGERPSSLLTSPFVPADEASGRTSPYRQQQQQQHYQNEIQMQQQQQHQIQQQLQQQQQQQAAYSNGYY